MAFNRGWIIDESDKPFARSRLNDIITFLTRQRSRQLLLENACAALFWGLATATVSVVVARLLAPQLTVFGVAASLVGVALVAALVKTGFERPDKLQVAIDADVQLRLKQRLSTAWEYAQRDDDPALFQYLAIQAINQRYPPRNQPVFRLRPTLPVRLLPLAALALILVSAVDLPVQRLGERAAPLVDDAVITEGARLREFARQFAARATRDRLPRSTGEAENMFRLGVRMESGTLSRSQALHRLRDLADALSEQRRAALADAGAPIAAPLSDSQSGTDNARLRELLERLMQGRMTAGELPDSATAQRGLSALGISSEELQRALDNWDAGNAEALRELVEQLAHAEFAEQDARELDKAARRVTLVRENLGDHSVPDDDFGDGQSTAAVVTDDTVGHISAPLVRPFADEHGGAAGARHGAGAGSGTATRQAPQSLTRSSRDDIALKPESQYRDGASFVTETRVLPRADRAQVPIVQLDPRFVEQVEQAFAREHYPAHHKDFIRRYFLALSQGTPSAQSAPAQQ